jgi:hypothetical protein
VCETVEQVREITHARCEGAGRLLCHAEMAMIDVKGEICDA